MCIRDSDNYAIQAFEVNAVDYVLKPFDKARIAKAIQRAKKMVEAHTSPAVSYTHLDVYKRQMRALSKGFRT